MTARDDLRVPFALAVAMAHQPVSMVDECLDEYEAAHRAEVLNEAADWLTKKYGVTNRAAGDLRRMAADPTAPTESKD
ncbi:hypothetical protein [Streptacidiphilus carbonis]|uniref:hypothetical protein n=1 Tax=Streptacidiphilus carbonis TaxID=105422 RepID=UPI0005A854C3|nr:hypothetical protein [Streptacidiphilus carbonis]